MAVGRGVLLPVLCLATAAACATSTSAGPGGSQQTHGTGAVQIRSGTYRGVAWHLYARINEGHLCMELRRTTGDRQVPFAGACLFDDDPDGGSYYYASGPGPRGSYVNYGPLPKKAVRVRIATKQSVPAYPFPKASGLPNANFWVDFEPASWPSPNQGRPLNDPEPLDRKGNPVAFKGF